MSAINKIQDYMQNKSYNPSATHPYFVSADNSRDYKHILNQLANMNMRQVRLSDYYGEESFPDYDLLIRKLKGLQGENILLLGLGETIYLQNRPDILNDIKSLNCGCGKIIVLCRGIWPELKKIADKDTKFAQERLCRAGKDSIDYSITAIKPEFDVNKKGISIEQLVHKLEDGSSGDFAVSTNLNITAQKTIKTAYQAIKADDSTFDVSETLLESDLWQEYNKDRKLDGFAPQHWRTFLKLKLAKQANPLSKVAENIYQERLLNASDNYAEYQEKFIYLLLNMELNDKEYWPVYDARKQLVKDIPEQDIIPYLQKSAAKVKSRIYYLTDNTQAERHEIIREISKYGLTENIRKFLPKIYPALSSYLAEYCFDCEKKDIFTPYFIQYRECKIQNIISAEFKEHLREFAETRPYNFLDTRNNIVEKLDDGSKYLYWLDALGAEYLPYIKANAKELGLAMQTYICRSVLPTITSNNKDFYENWKGKKDQSKKLDEIKHKGETGFNYENEKLPVHLADELEVIDSALNHIKGCLDRQEASSAVLASDHGASRLAVISGNENRHEMQEKGKHSGRCCPISEADKAPDCAAEENGYWVLADYSRFKGSRKASVEAHGGASLEEVIVPVIEFSLKSLKIQVRSISEKVYFSYNEPAELQLFCSLPSKNLTLRICGRRFMALPADGQNVYTVKLTGINKPGKYEVEVFCGDTYAGKISLQAESKGIRKNTDNDEFFS